MPREECDSSSIDGREKIGIAGRAIGSIDLNFSNILKEAIKA
jgi:hypothetical protein